jgi:U3 small nucleolar RNA-associated protein 11
MQGASTMRNAVKRVTHKERSQPKSRKRFGLLEKHKDYIERANDFKKKKATIKNLKKKAADRNPDEFYFNMHNSQVTNGVHHIKRWTTEWIYCQAAQNSRYGLHDTQKVHR